MNFEQFTHKTQEALQHAHESAQMRGHQGVMPAHVLLALLAQPEGVLAPLIEKAGQKVHVLNRELEDSLEKLPKIAAKRRTLIRHERVGDALPGGRARIESHDG